MPRFHDDHIVIYGTEGAIYLQGQYVTGSIALNTGSGWVEQTDQAEHALNLPKGLGDTEQCWHTLADLFVRDILGQSLPTYPTIKEGSLYQAIIDAIRRSETWMDGDSLQ